MLIKQRTRCKKKSEKHFKPTETSYKFALDWQGKGREDMGQQEGSEGGTELRDIECTGRSTSAASN